MSALNPEKALRALLPRPISIEGTDLCVRPLSLAAFALLDAIGSPLVREPGTAPDTPMALIPSLYVLTHDPLEVLDGMADANLLRTALKWADALPPDAMAKVERAARAQIAAVLAVAPQGKKAAGTRTTDGSRRSPTSRQAPTAGRSPTSSTASPPARSRS
ncbi:MAG: hypothetical protein IJ783_03230 [Kiritimatiellae bacterium]|nr:hypothetical protein [Kiritimatiellia bacterium]